MDLNKVRLIEACYRYLVDKLHPDMKSKIEGCHLIFECNQVLYHFQTYQDQPYKGAFAEYQLAAYELREQRKDIEDIYDLYKALRLKDSELSTLATIEDLTTVKILLFKLLINADLDVLSENYPAIKDNCIVYNLHSLTIDKVFPIYQFSNNSSFRLVAIT